MSGVFQDLDFDLDKIPSMPLVATRMIELINSPDVSAEELANTVEQDPAVSARVLRIANSSYYSMSRQVSTVQKAIVVLGERTLKNLVLAAGLRGMYQEYGKNEQMLWEESMVCALACRFLSSKLNLGDPEEAFMAGLFRHVGKLVINNQGYERELVAKLITNQCDNKTERELFGTGHAEIGAAVLEYWRLSELLSLVARHHFDVELSGITDDNTRQMICLSNIAGEFPRIFGLLGEEKQISLADLPGALKLQLGTEQLTELLEEFRAFFEQNRKQLLA